MNVDMDVDVDIDMDMDMSTDSNTDTDMDISIEKSVCISCRIPPILGYYLNKNADRRMSDFECLWPLVDIAHAEGSFLALNG
jgi:hypothetical protein